MIKPVFITLSLVVLNGAVLAVGVAVWRSGEDKIHAPEYLAIRNLAMPDLAAIDLAAPSTVDVAGIRDNAVFHNRRAFYVPPTPAQMIPAPDYDLAGIMGLPQGKRIAFVKKKSDQSSRTLHIGDDLDGWRVESIDAWRVFLGRESQHIEIKGETPAHSDGLVSSSTATRVAHAATQVLSAQGPRRLAPSSAEVEVRTYQPPAPPH